MPRSSTRRSGFSRRSRSPTASPRPGSTSWRPSWTRRGFRVPGDLWRRLLRQRRQTRRREPVGAHPLDPGALRDAAGDGASGAIPRRLATGLGRSRPPLRCERRGERHRRLPPARPAERPGESPRGCRRDLRRGEGALRRPRAQPGPGRRDGRARRARARAPRAGRRASPHSRSGQLPRPCEGA